MTNSADGRGTRGGARREVAYAAIMEKAIELFAERGFHATGVAELGRATGLGSGALYHYIGSKEELLFAILTAHIDQVIAFGREVQGRDLTAPEKLHELAREHMRVVTNRRLELVVVLRELESLTGERREEMLQRRDVAEGIWSEIVREGERDGELGTVDPMFVKIALGALNYTALWFRADGATGPEDMGDRIIGMLIAGQERWVRP